MCWCLRDAVASIGSDAEGEQHGRASAGEGSRSWTTGSPVPAATGGWSGCSADGRWLEGPAYHPAGRFVLFSDIPNDRVLRYDEISGRVDDFAQPAGFTNGRTVDRQGRFVTCEHGARRVTRGRARRLAPRCWRTRYEGHRLNSPNDVVAHSDGSIWFTDPSYGIRPITRATRPTRRSAPATSTGSTPPPATSPPSITDFDQPNGLAFTPDERRLFVVDSELHHIRVFDVDGATVSGGEVFAADDKGYDGIRFDHRGRLWGGGARRPALLRAGRHPDRQAAGAGDHRQPGLRRAPGQPPLPDRDDLALHAAGQLPRQPTTPADLLGLRQQAGVSRPRSRPRRCREPAAPQRHPALRHARAHLRTAVLAPTIAATRKAIPTTAVTEASACSNHSPLELEVGPVGQSPMSSVTRAAPRRPSRRTASRAPAPSGAAATCRACRPCQAHAERHHPDEVVQPGHRGGQQPGHPTEVDRQPDLTQPVPAHRRPHPEQSDHRRQRQARPGLAPVPSPSTRTMSAITDWFV